ncbi:ATP-dependent Clp protease ATP-binding subunit [Fibrella aquatilis]|uniref:ATP-dependent Clp protease ATP-binding subunit n=1 Tax=Fibrella aquatilis TaxID=2817059 RepID=A0A939K282_9BACT|nr:ATP-dependent Clp protease ATP-binding subunit [Fibrella aquatilis]MBO0934283.1 ATP-dependent Clp protease ATP-binding subunit [Fibrella aquatilis]
MLLSIETKRAFDIAKAHVHEYRHGAIAPAHLLLGLLHNDVGLASWLVALGKDIYFLRDWADYRLEMMPKAINGVTEPVQDATTTQVMQLADLIATQFESMEVEPKHVLAALLKANVAFTADQLKSLPVTQKEVLDAAKDDRHIQTAVNGQAGETAPATAAGSAAEGGAPNAESALARFGQNKTQDARDGKVDPIVGRDRELRLMLEILLRRTKPNVMLIGEPGVGKTALVEGFAQAIVAGTVPASLQNAELYELDLGSLVAGASYKGEVEDRIKNVIKEVKQHDKAILFIDEIHMLLNPNGSVGAGVSQLLKPELARGELTVIGATTLDEYRQYVEKDEAFSRRFEQLHVHEPTTVAATRMVETLIPRYEEHHNLKADEGVAEEAVRLAQRYVKDRRLPDAAIDLLDRTMAAIRTMGDTAAQDLVALRDQLTTATEHIADWDEPKQLAEYQWILQQVQHKVSPILQQQLEDDTQPDTIEIPRVLRDYLTNRIAELMPLAEQPHELVTKLDIAAMVAAKTGIPMGKLQTNERERLLKMDDVLRKRVVGQDHAIRTLTASILESRAGLSGGKQPTGAFFLLGPTGTGKTELAKALADFMFNDESFLIRFDMSEFKEEHSAALLYGAPPGYVGYEQGGMLVNKIREKPYSVVLFDEIEKAHPSVFDIFLQILDEGKLHDRLGKEGDFTNAVVLFTSNIGSEFVVRQFGEGIIPAPNDLMEIMSKHFRPEFLARLTEIVPFAPISEENVVKIFDIHLRGLTEPMRRQGIALEISPVAREFLALSGFTPRYGARPLKGVIRSQLRRPISRMIISGEVNKGDTLQVDLDENKELTWNVISDTVVEVL